MIYLHTLPRASIPSTMVPVDPAAPALGILNHLTGGGVTLVAASS